MLFVGAESILLEDKNLVLKDFCSLVRVNWLSTCSCRCSSKRNVAGAWQFSGISLSRFVNYWRNHGRTAISDIPAYAVSYFIAPARSQQEHASVNGSKRPRRLDHDSFKTEERESKSAERADGEVAGRVTSNKASEASDVICSERQELRRERALAGVKSGVKAEKRRAGAERLEHQTETRRRRCTQVAGLHSATRLTGLGEEPRALDFKVKPLGKDERGFPCAKKISASCTKRLLRRL